MLNRYLSVLAAVPGYEPGVVGSELEKALAVESGGKPPAAVNPV